MHSRKTSFSSHGSSSHSGSPSISAFTPSFARPNLSISLPNGTPVSPAERSVISLEKEIMRLQEVLKERESEISILEGQLKAPLDSAISPRTPTPSAKLNGNGTSLPRLDVKVNGQSDESDTQTTVSLSPKTIGQFNHIRKSMELNSHHNYASYTDASSEKDDSVISEADESLERLNELML